MKIVVTGTRGIPNFLGGIETHCEELYPRIVQHGVNVDLIRRSNYVADALSEYKGVRLHNVSSPKNKSLETIIHTLKSVFLAKFRYKADVVHIHAVGPGLVVPLAKILGLKVVFTHHGPDYDREKWGGLSKKIIRLGERFAVKFADEVIVISQVITDLIEKKYGRFDSHLIYNGVPTPWIIETTDYLSSLGVESGKYIFAMGRFVPEKNFHQLIEAFSKLDNIGYKLVLAGDADFNDAYSKGLKQQAKEAGVILTGFVKGNKLHELLSHAACFVLPSSHEGLPIALLEAMSYGLPAVVSDIPANLEVGLPDSDYFKVGDVNHLSNVLRRKLEEIALNPRIAYNMAKYKWDTIAEQTVEVYERLRG